MITGGEPGADSGAGAYPGRCCRSRCKCRRSRPPGLPILQAATPPLRRIDAVDGNSLEGDPAAIAVVQVAIVSARK